MKSIISALVHRPLVVNVFLFLVVVLGLDAMKNIEREAFPPVQFQEYIILVTYKGGSPRDLELGVTKYIEDKIRGIDGIRDVDSQSMEGVSKIDVKFDIFDENDKLEILDDLRQAVDEAKADFPDDTDEPIFQELDFSMIPAIQYHFASSKIPEKTLRKYARALRDQIEDSVEGVSFVDFDGYQDRQVRVLFYPEKLKKYRVSVTELSKAVQEYNIRIGGGKLKIPGDQKDISIISEFETVEDLLSVNIRNNFDDEGRVEIRDVADVLDDLEERDKYTLSNGREGISLLVYPKEKMDTIRLVEQVNKVVKEYVDNLSLTDAFLPSDIQFELKKLSPESGVDILLKNAYRPLLSKANNSDLSVTPIFDTTANTKTLLNIVFNNAMLGLFLVIVTLTIFFDFRIAFWTGFGIPISFALTFLIFYFLGSTLNNMLLFGLITVLGILVDDGIVVAESIYSLREQGFEAKEAAIKASSRLFKPILGTVLTTMFAFLPVLLDTQNINMQFLKPMAAAIIIALMASVLEVFLSLPVHLSHANKYQQSHLDKPKKVKWGTRIFIKWGKFHAHFLRAIIPFRYLVLLFFILLLGLTGLLVKTIPFSTYTNEDVEDLSVSLEAKNGTTVEQMLKLTNGVEKKIMDHYGLGNPIDSVYTIVGQKGNFGDVVSDSTKNAEIQLKLVPTARRNIFADEIVEDLKKLIATKPEFDQFVSHPAFIQTQLVKDYNETHSLDDFEKAYAAFYGFIKGREPYKYFGAKYWFALQKQNPLSSPNMQTNPMAFTLKAVDEISVRYGLVEIQPKVTSFGPNVGEDVEIVIKNSDNNIRESVAQEILAFLNGILGLSSIDYHPKLKDSDEVHFDFDFNMMNRVGVTPYTIATVIRTAYEGLEVGTVSDPEEKVEIHVQMARSEREKWDVLKNLMIPTTGRDLPLGNLVTPKIQSENRVIRRIDGKRITKVVASTDSKYITPMEVSFLVDQRFGDIATRYPGTTIVYDGQIKATKETLDSTQIIALLALLFIAFTLIVTLNSLIQPLLILIIVPFSFIGSIVGLKIHGLLFTVFGLIGIVGLMGVVINDSIVLIDRINEYVPNRRKMDFSEIKDKVIMATESRLRPIILTTITTVMGLLPSIYPTGFSDTLYVLKPLAVGMVFGLMFGTFLTLVFLPNLYLIEVDIQKGFLFIKNKFLALFIKKQ